MLLGCGLEMYSKHHTTLGYFLSKDNMFDKHYLKDNIVLHRNSWIFADKKFREFETKKADIKSLNKYVTKMTTNRNDK